MSTLSVSNITDGTTTVGTSYVVNGSAKAFARTNTAGDAILGTSLNMSSITDIAAGKSELNLTNAMSTVDSPSVGGQQAGNIGDVYTEFYPDASTLRFYITNTAHAYTDYEGTAVAFGDLA